MSDDVLAHVGMALPHGLRGIMRFLNVRCATLFAEGPPMKSKYFTESLALAMWAHAQGCSWGCAAAPRAAAQGRLDVLQWLHEETGYVFDKWTSFFAVRYANPEVRVSILSWLHRQRLPLDPYISTDAAEDAQWDVLRWCDKRRFVVPYAMAKAARGGHLDIIQWLRRRGYEWHAAVCTEAAIRGNVRVLAWAIDNHCPWSGYEVGENAAYYGHLHVLEWLQGCGLLLLHEDMAAAAAGGGQLTTLTYLRSLGCPWDCRVLHDAELHEHHAVYEWALAHGCPVA